MKKTLSKSPLLALAMIASACSSAPKMAEQTNKPLDYSWEDMMISRVLAQAAPTQLAARAIENFVLAITDRAEQNAVVALIEQNVGRFASQFSKIQLGNASNIAKKLNGINESEALSLINFLKATRPSTATAATAKATAKLEESVKLKEANAQKDIAANNGVTMNSNSSLLFKKVTHLKQAKGGNSVFARPYFKAAKNIVDPASPTGRYELVDAAVDGSQDICTTKFDVVATKNVGNMLEKQAAQTEVIASQNVATAKVVEFTNCELARTAIISFENDLHYPAATAADVTTLKSVMQTAGETCHTMNKGVTAKVINLLDQYGGQIPADACRIAI